MEQQIRPKMEFKRITIDEDHKTTCDGCGHEMCHILDPAFQLTLFTRDIILFFCYDCKRKLN